MSALSTRQITSTPSVPNRHLFNMQQSKSVTYQNLKPSDPAYQEVANLITNESIIIENIVKIKNSFLDAAYQLKKAQKEAQYGEVRESLLFHGTKKDNVDSICTNNFNWRLYGTNTGHKFGKGVSFSTSAMYASNYSDIGSYHKVMIVAKVLVAKVCPGNEEMAFPLTGCDTSQKGDHGIVMVKYEDHEFLPLYKIFYHVDDDYDYDDNYDIDEADYDYDEAVYEHDEALHDYDEALHDYEEALYDHDEALRDHDEALRDHDEALRDHDEALLDCNEALRDCDEALRDCDEALYDHDVALYDHDESGDYGHQYYNYDGDDYYVYYDD